MEGYPKPPAKGEPKVWTKCDWPYDNVFQPECWKYPVRRGWIFLYAYPDGKPHYVQSCGPNSEDSFGGCFYGMENIKSMGDAKAELIRQLKKSDTNRLGH